ncbi:MAG TPA: DUF882 domain-containing protein, partial [Polyangiaceae bacterium]|nr:DUF882 domain-containing protein [Polyangiaceae bacterium]
VGAALAVEVGAVRPARADVTHVVQKGHTVEAIAHRYRVTVKSILDANHLKDASHLKPGQTLVIPGVKAPHGSAGATLQQGPEPRGHTDKNVIRAVRLGEEFRIRVKDTRGHIGPATLKSFERLMRQGEATHPPDPRLVALIGVVSQHFDGHTIEVVSGYRAYAPTQYTPHSNHNSGKALDFRIQGVQNESVRDFCMTLRNTGCGYYPNSTFVHLDVRESKAYWVDRSRPGEPPLYDRPGVMADEGASEVPTEDREGAGNDHEAGTVGTTPGSLNTLPPLPREDPDN